MNNKQIQSQSQPQQRLDLNMSQTESQCNASDAVTPEPLNGITQQTHHTAEATMELHHLTMHKNMRQGIQFYTFYIKMFLYRIVNNMQSIDRMLDALHNRSGLSITDVVSGSVKHIIETNNRGKDIIWASNGSIES